MVTVRDFIHRGRASKTRTPIHASRTSHICWYPFASFFVSVLFCFFKRSFRSLQNLEIFVGPLESAALWLSPEAAVNSFSAKFLTVTHTIVITANELFNTKSFLPSFSPKNKYVGKAYGWRIIPDIKIRPS